MATNYYQDPYGAPDYSAEGMQSLLSLSNLESLGRGSVAGLLGLPKDLRKMLVTKKMQENMDFLSSQSGIPQVPYFLPSSEELKQRTPRMTAPTPQAGLLEDIGSFMSPVPAGAVVPLARGGKGLARMAGERMAENVMMGRPNLPGLLAEPPSALFAVLPQNKLPPKPTKAAPQAKGLLEPDVDLEYLQNALLQSMREKNVGLSEFASTTPTRIQNKTKAGGYSVNLPSGQLPDTGLMMGRYANTDPRNMVIPAGNKLTREDILNFASINKNALKNPENYLGTWQDGPNGPIYLDTSKRFDPSEIRSATKFGEKTGQLAGYDVGAGQTIPVGNWEQFINSPEFIGPTGRLAQMEIAGRNYLSNFPTGNWWDIRGSNMEKVYGKENLPQVAGFTASTAPVSAPRENIQTMSEYMRRYIKGEPTLQPDWRVPAGMMTRTEGVQIGMEGSRANNLIKSGLGDYANLSGKKVGEEGRALMGDPNAVVLDRHQIRVSEDPSRGIYASGTADIITPDQYDSLKNAIVTYTKNHSSKNANEASADIWTGIRETIKNKSDLFGTKFQGSAVTGDSKSYIDHFNDLIKDKAKHLGISIKEMEAKLRAGDANLMSFLLATPVGLEAWDRFQEGQAKGD